MIDRRKFFELMLAPAVAASIPVGEWLVDPWQEPLAFDPSKQYGNVATFADPTAADAVLDEVVSEMRRFIPRGYEVEMVIRLPSPSHSDPLATVGVIGWKYSPSPRGQGRTVVIA